jgi:hypothetical protein
MTTWQPIETAPRDGRPVWVKGWNWGDKTKGIHCCWAWFDGNHWAESGVEDARMEFLFEWLPAAITQSC